METSEPVLADGCALCWGDFVAGATCIYREDKSAERRIAILSRDIIPVNAIDIRVVACHGYRRGVGIAGRNLRLAG